MHPDNEDTGEKSDWPRTIHNIEIRPLANGYMVRVDYTEHSPQSFVALTLEGVNRLINTNLASHESTLGMIAS